MLDEKFNGKCPAKHEVMSSDTGNEQYIVNTATKKRIVSNERLNKAGEIALRFIANAELADTDTEFETIAEVRDFILANAKDAEVGVNVVKGDKYREVKGIYDVAYAESKIAELVDAED